ncbi:FXYD domain-containing ion transport regulator 6-like [Eleutherodactylus coqui]|uniref:FXYD domain-containing ion transport regulator 6-like n=1 Tax=Eleutherodactylus coqui TaxID=57060 RepID=UPI003462934C
MLLPNVMFVRHRESALCGLVMITAALCTGCAAEHDHFHYDYGVLRMGGLIFAGVMLMMGIIVLLSDSKVLHRKKKEMCKVTSDP